MICSICYNSEDVKTAKLNDTEIHLTSQLKPQNLTAANIGVFTASLGYDYRHLLHFFSPLIRRRNSYQTYQNFFIEGWKKNCNRCLWLLGHEGKLTRKHICQDKLSFVLRFLRWHVISVNMLRNALYLGANTHAFVLFFNI